MEKIKFAAQVLLFMTVIPVLFISSLSGNDARVQVRESKQHVYTTNANPKIARLIFSCGARNTYVKK